MAVAWFSMDCNIFTNRKVQRLSELLKLDVDTVVGKLGRLYAWAAQCGNESGDISHLPPAEIADIMRWRKKPNVLVDAMADAGLLDQAPGGGYMIHDWAELNGRWLEKKRKDRERK